MFHRLMAAQDVLLGSDVNPSLVWGGRLKPGRFPVFQINAGNDSAQAFFRFEVGVAGILNNL